MSHLDGVQVQAVTGTLQKAASSPIGLLRNARWRGSVGGAAGILHRYYDLGELPPRIVLPKQGKVPG